MLAVPRAPEAKKLLGESVEESRAKRVEKQQSRYRDRGGIFVPADSNPLLDILLARGVNGESPTKSPARSTRRNGTKTSSPVKGKRKVALADDVAQGNGSRGEKNDNNAKARSGSKSTKQASSKAARGRKPKANVDIEANGEPVAGPSNVRGVKRNTKQGTRSARTKPKPLPTEADDDDDRPLGRSRKSKGKSADVAALNDPSDSGHHDAAEREGKQPSKSRNERKCGTERGDPDSDGDEPPAQKAKVKGKRKTPSGKADGKTGQETAEEPIPADVADAAEASDSKLTKGKQKAVDDASDVHIDKPERRPVTKAKRKIAPAKHDDQDADARPVPKPKGHKRTANRKRKAADTTVIDEVRQKTPLDTSEKLRSPESSPSLPVPRRHLITLTSIHGASGSSELAAVEHESQTRPASVRRKRPYMYISSDSESEDDVPLRRAKPPSKALKRDTETAREAKRAKTDKEAAADEGSESKPSEKKRRGGQTKTGRARRKKDGGGSGTEEGPADELRQPSKAVVKAVETAAAQQIESLEHATSLEDRSVKSGKREAGKQAYGASAAETAAGEPAALGKGKRAREKRQKADTDNEKAEGEDREQGAKRRKKTTADAEEHAVAVTTQVQNAGRSTVEHARSRDGHQKREAHELRPPSRQSKENRKAPVTKKATNAHARARKPMPRLSMFPSPGMADDSEDEINFLR